MASFIDEHEGQIDFYTRFLPRIDKMLCIDDVITDCNDGVLNGNLLEFKKDIKNLNAALFQAIKYESGRRIKGKPVTANIIILDVNEEKAWLYKTKPYLKYIEKIYIGGASKGNNDFVGDAADEVFNYADPLEADKLIQVLKKKEYTKINIDENCIVGWAMAYYAQNASARKEDFLGDDTGKHKTIGEIRSPRVFKDYINPYMGETNVKFNYLMDKLNDTLQKKNLGAFYTHKLYAEKSLELVREAIKRVPEGNDYIILDRCAGTGNLEMGLSDIELSHCIVSTVEYYEYKVLLELIGDKVRHIIPPIETKDTFIAGLVSGADALSKEFIENPIIKQYVDNPKCSIILFENPPYAETMSIEWHKKKESKVASSWKKSYVVTQMRNTLRGTVRGTVTNDMGNAFIWSGFKYYLRQPTDSYIVYSPVKYWKAQHLVEKRLIQGFAFNKRHFHTNIAATIMCALWSNEEDTSTKEFDLIAYDIIEEKLVLLDKKLPVKKIQSVYSEKYYDSRTLANDTLDGILTGLNGLEAQNNVKRRIAARYSDSIIGYMVADSSGFDNPDTHSSLLVAGRYNGNGFFVRKDNYLEKLPMFCATRYITYNSEWTERGRIMKSADGSARYFFDVNNGKLEQFLLKCLLFTCVEMQNHMRTFVGSDERIYRNELCLDITTGETIASKELKRLIKDESETKIINQYETTLRYAKQCEGYDCSLTYGVYQIATELDVSYVDKVSGKRVWKNKELHSALQGLKVLVKEYYNREIVPVLFEYEFLK